MRHAFLSLSRCFQTAKIIIVDSVLGFSTGMLIQHVSINFLYPKDQANHLMMQPHGNQQLATTTFYEVRYTTWKVDG